MNVTAGHEWHSSQGSAAILEHGDWLIAGGGPEGLELRRQLDSSRSWVPAPSAPRVRGRRPVVLQGRETLLGEAHDAVRRHRLLEISGEAGIGKSAFLRELAWRLQPSDFPDGILLVCARQCSLDDLLQQIFDRFFCASPAAPHDYKPTNPELRKLLSYKQAAILIDSLDANVRGLELVAETLPLSAVVFAARKPRLEGSAHLIALPGLAEPDWLELCRRLLNRALHGEESALCAKLRELLRGNPQTLLLALARAGDGQALLESVRHQSLESAKFPFSSTKARTGGTPAARTSDSDDPDRDARRVQVLELLAALPALSMGPSSVHTLLDLPEAQSVLNQLVADGLAVEQDTRYRLAEDLTESPDALGLDGITPDAIAQRLQTTIEHFVGDVQLPAVGVPMSTLCVLAERAQQLGLHETCVRFARVVSDALLRSRQWDLWQRALRAHLCSARAITLKHEEAWALHQLGTACVCLGYSAEGRRLLVQACRIRRRLADSSGVDLTEHNLALLGPRLKRQSLVIATALTGLFAGGLALGSALRTQQDARAWPELELSPPQLSFVARAEGEAPGGPRLDRSQGRPALVTVIAPLTPAQAVKVENRGREPLTISGWDLVGDVQAFVVAHECLDTVVAPGASCEIRVDFAPPQHGRFLARLSIESNDPRGTQSVLLVGDAIPGSGDAWPQRADP